MSCTPDFLFTGCGNSGKFLKLSEPPFLQWQVGDNTVRPVELLRTKVPSTVFAPGNPRYTHYSKREANLYPFVKAFLPVIFLDSVGTQA